MNKTIYFLILISIFVLSSFAKEPTLAKLNSVFSNGIVKFSISQNTFICRTYGVITVDELYMKAQKGSTCKKSIDKFYRKNPLLKYYTASLLKLNQYYHVEFKNNRCIIYAKGLNTLSEILLIHGLGVKKVTFDDEEFKYNFLQAQEDAKENNLGMHKNKIPDKCIEEIYAIENGN